MPPPQQKIKPQEPAFLAENAKKPNIVTTASGLQYEVLTPGTGATSPSATDNVTVHYKGTTSMVRVWQFLQPRRTSHIPAKPSHRRLDWRRTINERRRQIPLLYSVRTRLWWTRRRPWHWPECSTDLWCWNWSKFNKKTGKRRRAQGNHAGALPPFAFLPCAFRLVLMSTTYQLFATTPKQWKPSLPMNSLR